MKSLYNVCKQPNEKIAWKKISNRNKNAVSYTKKPFLKLQDFEENTYIYDRK